LVAHGLARTLLGPSIFRNIKSSLDWHWFDSNQRSPRRSPYKTRSNR
jgi:hypothetical protein